jgi:hypothetical protein
MSARAGSCRTALAWAPIRSDRAARTLRTKKLRLRAFPDFGSRNSAAATQNAALGEKRSCIALDDVWSTQDSPARFLAPSEGISVLWATRRSYDRKRTGPPAHV